MRGWDQWRPLPRFLKAVPFRDPRTKSAYTYQHRYRAISLRLGLLIPAKLSFSLTSAPPHPPQ